MCVVEGELFSFVGGVGLEGFGIGDDVMSDCRELDLVDDLITTCR